MAKAEEGDVAAGQIVSARSSVPSSAPTAKGVRSTAGPSARGPFVGPEEFRVANPNRLFVGREHEQQVLRAAIDAVRTGHGRLALLAGEAGVGKTRIAEELARYAPEHGVQVFWGCCSEDGGAPAFWPWVQILRAAIKGMDRDSLAIALGTGAADIAQLVPELRVVLPDIPSIAIADSPQARFRVFDGITRFLDYLAARAPVLLIIDDLHGADPSSLRLIEFIVRELRSMPLMMLASYRDVGLTSTHPLTGMLVEGLRVSDVERLTLSGWSASEIAEFIERSTHIAPAASLVRAVHQRTEGNPLFVGEYVRLLLSEGSDTVTIRPVPHTVRAVIARRLAPLPSHCRDVLRVAAVIGREFGLQLLASVLLLIGALEGGGDSGDDPAGALDIAGAAGIITARPDCRGATASRTP